MKTITTEQFCQGILNLDINCAKSLANLIMSLASYTPATSVVELSASPLFQHQYSSIRDAISGIGSTLESSRQTLQSFRELCLEGIDLSREKWIHLQTDATPVVKAHSACLPDRQYIKIANNVIASNKPISIGYPLSLVNIGCFDHKWSLPLDIRRITSTQTASECAVEQLADLLNEKTSKLYNRSLLNMLDSAYGHPSYLAPTYQYEKLVNNVRFRYGKKVWLPSQTTYEGKGSPSIYGEKFYLIDQSQWKTYKYKEQAHKVYQKSIFDLPHQHYLELEGKTAKGRKLKILLWRWNDLLIRSKDGKSMKDKSFDVIASKVIDADSGKAVFNRTMFTTLHGKAKDQITTQQAFQTYRHRYDIEPAIKFAKQKLLLDKFQTPDRLHFDNWLVVVMAAFNLLYLASKEAKYLPKKWQQYKPINQKANKKQTILSPSQAYQAAQSLFLTFDLKPFKPQNTNKGKGRKKGTTFSHRTEYKVVKKNKKKKKNPKIKIKTEQRE